MVVYLNTCKRKTSFAQTQSHIIRQNLDHYYLYYHRTARGMWKQPFRGLEKQTVNFSYLVQTNQWKC